MGLPQQVDRLQELVAAFYQLGSSLELSVVLRNSLRSATRLLNAQGGSISLLNEAGSHLEFVETSNRAADEIKKVLIPVGEGICGHVAATGKSVRVEDATTDPRFFDGIDRRLEQRTRTYLCVPLIIDGKVIGTAQVLNRLDGESFSAEDELLLEGFARQASLAITKARLHEYELLQKALESELEVCAAIQRQLFPKTPPQIAGFEVFGSSIPCREVGGDYFTYVGRDNGGWDVALADVSGKGLPAAMIVADVHTGFHLLSEMGRDLGTVMSQLNTHLTASLPSNKFVTMAAARLNPSEDAVEVAVAGHIPPVVIRSTGEISMVEGHGPLLGVLDMPVSTEIVTMQTGDLLLTFSDGYSEAERPGGSQLGEQAVYDAVASWASLPLAEIGSRLDALTKKHRDGRPPQDDVTLLLVRRI